MAVRPIDANALARRIREYMDDFLNATTRLATCRAILSMLGDENQTPTLHPITREQVEKMRRGEWKCQSDCGVTECTACKWNIEEYCGDYNFCPHCGAPMNDEAIQMVMERINELRGE